jgi:hypothetical protein
MRRMMAWVVGGLLIPTGAFAGFGSITLIDSSGLKFFIDTDVAVNSSSASGAMEEASYTHAVAASTMGGGTSSAILTDAFDGFYGLVVNGVFYTHNGPGGGGPPITTECPGPTTATNRQVVFNPQTIGNLQVSRKVFVPDNDSFGRWLNIITNVGAGTEAVTVSTSCNLGSDAKTVIVTSSDGNVTADLADTWVATFQDFTGTSTSDVRLGHVLQGPGATVPLKTIAFTNGDDNPTWSYDLNLAPGKTAIILTFVAGQPSRAAAAAKAAEIVGLPATTVQCMTPTDLSRVVNFCAVVAAAGGPQTINAFATTSGLGGSDPGEASGAWSIVSGGTGTFSPNANTPNASFTHTGGVGPITLRWSIANGSCPESSAHMVVNLTFQALVVKKAKINLNFAKANADTMKWTGTLPVPAGFTLAGQAVAFDLGGVQQAFTLDAHGRGTAGSNKLRLHVKSKHGNVPAQDAKFTLVMKGAFASQLADENLTGTANVKPAQSRTVNAVVEFNGTGLLKAEAFDYTARANKLGRARSR